VTDRSHVLFDLDGTLTDSAPGIVASLQHALLAEGLAVPAEEVLLGAIGPPFEVGLPLLGIPTEQVVAIVTRYGERYESSGLYENGLYDGVVEMLDALAAGGAVLGVATAKPEPLARRIIEHFALTDRFAVIAGATYEPGRRTKTEIVAHALAGLGIEGGAHVVMVGDRDHDVLAARELGLVSIGVTWGYGPREELIAAGADVLADSPAEVIEVIDVIAQVGSSAMGDVIEAPPS
jgi:phosphoglycolate phosphatase